jgi:molybdopterin-synthase adenylyltransferase
MLKDWNVAMSRALHVQFARHLIRADGQEDLAFALWNPSSGSSRETALLTMPLLPAEGEREVHGNVSFMPIYFERACRMAIEHRCGIAFLHSHPTPGWQGMSRDDLNAEQKMAGATLGLTGLPLVGMTVGNDGTWSARLWLSSVGNGQRHHRQWCSAVRIVGTSLRIDFTEELRPRPQLRELFRRTVAMWGSESFARMTRLRVGVVGLGSVGSLVVECLARMGFQDFVLIDFDRVEAHNLDRLVIATERDIGQYKVDVAHRRLEEVRTADNIQVQLVQHSVAEEGGYRAALDCDVLFSCVDRPRPRHVLNHLAYAHLVPVIDGGIAARFKNGVFSGVDWQVHTVGPDRPCLNCLRTYDLGDVSTEEAGKLEDPTYLAGLPNEHRFKRNENVFPFSMNVASLEVLQLVAMVTSAAGVDDFGVQRYRYIPGIMEQLTNAHCDENCDFSANPGVGDKYFSLIGRDIAAERSRTGRRSTQETKPT